MSILIKFNDIHNSGQNFTLDLLYIIMKLQFSKSALQIQKNVKIWMF